MVSVRVHDDPRRHAGLVRSAPNKNRHHYVVRAEASRSLKTLSSGGEERKNVELGPS